MFNQKVREMKTLTKDNPPLYNFKEVYNEIIPEFQKIFLNYLMLDKFDYNDKVSVCVL